MGIIDRKPLAIDKRTDAEREADTIFGCVFLGFLADGLEHGHPLGWDVEPEKNLDEVVGGLTILHETLSPLANRVAEALRKKGLTLEDASVGIGTSPTHWYAVERNEVKRRSPEDAKYVGIQASGIRSDPKTRQQGRPSEELTNYVVENLIGDLEIMQGNEGYESLLRSKTDTEYGAYYGIVDHKGNFPAPKVISSVRRLIPYDDEHGRWNRDVPYHGLISYERQLATDKLMAISEKQAGSFERTNLIREWSKAGGKGRVCGYCHGMNWAVAQAACSFPDGTAYELGLGKNTLKLSSCFGCTTFMYSNGLAPSSAHLGRAESWVPLPEDDDSAGVFLDSTRDGVYPAKEVSRILGTFKQLNRQWACKVSEWLMAGADLIADDDGGMFEDWAMAHAEALRRYMGSIDSSFEEEEAVRRKANLFLDALTIHKKDIDRLRNIQKAF